jgi:hypothetical protein
LHFFENVLLYERINLERRRVMPKSGLLAGKKVNDRHSSVIDEAKIVVQIAQSLSDVTKIVISIILPKAGSRTPRIDFAQVPAGLKLIVRGTTAAQQFFVYTDNPDGVERAITDAWSRKRR